MVSRSLAVLLILAAPLAATAAPAHYTIVPGKSVLSFQATENHVKVTGAFAAFSGDIVFSPDQLAAGSVKITIDTANVTSDADQVAGTLPGADWFDAAKFPQATFTAQGFKSLGGRQYEADGTLTLKGISQLVVVLFTLKAYDATHAVAEGTAKLQRTAFHVGWNDTGTIEDSVKVSFAVEAAAAK